MDINTATDYGMGMLNNLKKNWRIIVLWFLFSAGLVIGAVIIKSGDSYIADGFNEIFRAFISAGKSQSIGTNFLNSLAANMLFLLLSFILGLCAVGMPFIAALPVIRGLGIGMLSGYLYSTFALNGLGYCVLILYPGLIPSVFALLLSCNSGLSSSLNILMSISSNKSLKGEGSLKIYSMRFILILILTLIASMLDSVVLRLFSGFFNF